MSYFNNIEYELYALISLCNSFPQFVSQSIRKYESPDWLDVESGIGIEVSRAESTEIGDAKNLANQYLGKSRCLIPERRIEKFSGKLWFDEDNCLYGISYTKGLFDADRHIYLALDSVKRKLEKLNTHFYHVEENCLYLYLAFSLLEDNRDLFLSEYSKLCKKYKICFNHIFLMGHEKICHVDYRKKELNMVSFQEDCMSDMDRNVHALYKLSKWENGTSFFNIWEALTPYSS